MATADDYVLAMADEENLSRIEFKNVAIFFTSLDGKPVKIGRLGNPVNEPTTQPTTEQDEPSGDFEEGTRVHLSFEEHPAIDARLSLSLYHVYKPAPSDRQKENGIDPDQTSQRRTLHLGKVNLEETPMYRKVILSAKSSGEDNEDKSSAGDPTDDEDYFSAIEPTDDEARKAKAERPKPKAEQPWRVVADPVDRMLPPVPFEEIADQINMNKDMLTALLDEGGVWEVFLRFTPEGDYMTNWVTSQHDYGSQTEVVAATREIIKTKFTLRLYIAALPGFEAMMNHWIGAFVDHCRANALYKWIVPKKRFYVQTGQIKPDKYLPPKRGFSLPARMSFKEWDEYCLIQGFLILEALDVTTAIDCRIPAVALRLIHMPGARNKSQPTDTRAYFAAIHQTDDSNEGELASRLSGLKEGEKLGVCFNTRHESRVESWHAIVVSTVDGNQDEYIVALIRPFDKVKGKYTSIPLESPEPIQLGKVKDGNDLRRKLISQDGFLVTIFRDDSMKDYTRSLRALGEITYNKENLWDDRKKMLLMSNFGSEAPLIDFFATLSTAARNDIFTDLYAKCNLEQKAALRTMCAVPHGIFILPGCGGSGKTWLCANIIKKLVSQDVMNVEGEVRTADMNTKALFDRQKDGTSQKTPKEKPNKGNESTNNNPKPSLYAEDSTASPTSDEDGFAIPNKHQVLFVVCLNKTLNDMMERLYKDLQEVAKNAKTPRPIVVRAYSINTDKKIYQHPAKKARSSKLAILERPPIIQDDGLDEPEKEMLELAHVRDLMDHYKTHTKQRHGTTDPRLGDVALSMGYWVLVLTGLISEKHEVFTKPHLFRRFRELYRQYSKGEKINLKLLSEQYRRACRYVMSVADVIGTTPSNCADERIYLGAHPNITIIDEGGKVTEMFLLPIFAYFPHCRRFLIAGDPRQNRAHQGSVNGANCHFSNQARVSILERALVSGAARVYQNHQHRQISSLNRLPNEKWYGGALTTDPETDKIPEALQFRECMQGMFGIKENLVFLDVAGTVNVRIGKNPSWYNYGQLRLAVHVIIDLLRARFKTSDIVFMAPYLQQLSMMRRALLDLSKVPAFSELQPQNISCMSYDTMQGMEAGIVVTTLTVTKRIGFLRDKRRLNTEATRPRFGHIIIGTSLDMEKDRAYRGSAVKDLVDFCKENGIRKYVDLDTMGCVHIPSVRVEEMTFVDRSAAHEESTGEKSDNRFAILKSPQGAQALLRKVRSLLSSLKIKSKQIITAEMTSMALKKLMHLLGMLGITIL